ncbi:MAG: peptide chain release factor-like protein [Chlamydiales bacterium]|nr:peptide chain release factor-like protein [Chlamydiales bacterium]
MIHFAKIEEIKKQMQELGIKEDDIEEKFILGSGRGGQHLQKTHSCVQLMHIPSKIEVRCFVSRNREENRWIGRRLLCEKFTQMFFPEKSKKLQKIEKIKKQKQKSKKRSAEKYQKQSSN